MFSNTSEYALRAIVHLAANPDKPCTNGDIAEATKVPPGYLSKVLQSLARAGIVSAQRGPTGGFTLRLPASRVSVLDVINAVDPIQRITKCPLDIPSHAAKLCKLHARLDDAIGMVETALAESSIAEMVEDAPHRAQRVQATINRRAPAAQAAKSPGSSPARNAGRRGKR